MEAVVFGDAEALAVTYLTPLLGVPVSTRVPTDRTGPFVRVVRTGGQRRDVVTDLPVLTFECWGPPLAGDGGAAASETQAWDLGARTRAYVGALAQTTVAGVWVRAVEEVGGLASFPDPVSETPRYQFSVQLHTRGAPL